MRYGWTNGPTDQWTNGPSLIVANPRLKRQLTLTTTVAIGPKCGSLISFAYSRHLFMSSCHSPHKLSNDVCLMSMVLLVYELWCLQFDASFAYCYSSLLNVTFTLIAFNLIAYERPVPCGWASLDMALHIVATIMSFVMSLHTHYPLSLSY